MTDIIIKKSRGGDITVAWPGHDVGRSIPMDEAAALREYFQAEFFDGAGWWLAPGGGFLVRRSADEDCADGGRAVVVLDLAEGNFDTEWENYGSAGAVRAAAGAYFNAHREPKPWMDAAPGEVWMLTMEGEERPAIVTEDGNFEAPLFLVTPQSVRITAGRRIYPAQNGDNDE